MDNGKNRKKMKLVLEISVLSAFIIWSVFSYYLPALFLLPAVLVFTAALFLRSWLRYWSYFRTGENSSSFGQYVRERRVIFQNVAAGLILGSFGNFLKVIAYVSDAIGATYLLLIFDLIISALILTAFFIRPGKWRTLNRTEPGYGEYRDLLHNLADRYGIDNVELRIIPFSRSRTVNASSWGLPAGRKVVFATESLFMTLQKEQIGGIFTHELAHLKYRHSSKSFLISSFVPLLWFNGLLVPALPGNFLIELLPFSISVVFAVLYFFFGRGFISRRYEDAADLYTARHWDKDTYLSALKKLAEVNGSLDPGRGKAPVTHGSIEEREKLIREA